MSDRLNILVLSGEPPYPPTHGGDRIRLYHLLKALAPRHAITLVTSLEPAADREFLAPLQALCSRVLAFPLPTPARRPTWQDLFVAYHKVAYTAAMAQAITVELQTNPYNLVYAHGARMALYTAALGPIPKIIGATDSASLAFRNRFSLATGLKARLFALYGLRLVTRHERKLYRQFDACVVVAERDAHVIRQLCPGLDVRVIPNGTELDYFRPEPQIPAEPHRLIFTGTMDFPPNVDAVKWFCREVLPVLQLSCPETVFEIAGRNPTAEIAALAKTGTIEVAGYLPDLRPHLAQAAVYVCPLRQGSGIKNKVLEAMAMGKAIVTTTEGVSGIGATAGREYLVADDRDSFAAAVRTLLRSPDRRSQLATAARAFVEQHFSWPRTAAELDQLFLHVARKKGSS